MCHFFILLLAPIGGLDTAVWSVCSESGWTNATTKVLHGRNDVKDDAATKAFCLVNFCRLTAWSGRDSNFVDYGGTVSVRGENRSREIEWADVFMGVFRQRPLFCVIITAMITHYSYSRGLPLTTPLRSCNNGNLALAIFHPRWASDSQYERFH